MHAHAGSDVYSIKRGRPQYSSLIAFPRVGRSSGNSGSGSGTRDLMYYGQKRGGKSGLIPFPRVGRGGANTWDLGEDDEGGHGRYEAEERGKLHLWEYLLISWSRHMDWQHIITRTN